MIESASYIPHTVPMPDDGLCPYCGVAMDGTYPAVNAPVIDHTIPLSKGGRHTPDNTLMICNRCNCIKRDRPVSYLLEKLHQSGALAKT